MEKLTLFATYLSQENKNVVLLNWSFSSDKELFEKFIIMKSTDNKEFKIIGKEKRMTQVRRAFMYLFVDENLVEGNNYYRICCVTRGKYSKIVPISNTVTVMIGNAQVTKNMSGLMESFKGKMELMNN